MSLNPLIPAESWKSIISPVAYPNWGDSSCSVSAVYTPDATAVTWDSRLTNEIVDGIPIYFVYSPRIYTAVLQKDFKDQHKRYG